MFKCLNLRMLKWNGFTLVELLVIVFIIMLMSGIIFANYRQSGQRLALQRSANKLAQDIRRVQEMATSVKEFQGVIPEGGYGIRFRDEGGSPPIYTYIIYADCNKNAKYDGETVGPVPYHPFDPDSNPLNPDIACTEGVDCPCNGYSEKIEVIRVEKGVALGIGPDGAFFGGSRVIFTPPDPTITIAKGMCDLFTEICAPWDTSYSLLTATVYLEADPSQIKTIRINKVGLIEIE